MLETSNSDFSNLPWQAVIDNHGDKTCRSYAKVLREHLSNYAVDSLEYNFVLLLQRVCGLSLNLDDHNAPYVASIIFGRRRTAALDDFTPNELTTLAKIASSINDAELKARIADVLWVTRTDAYVDFARLAIQAFLESASNLLRPGDWVEGYLRIERALQLAYMLGRDPSKNSDLDRIILFIDNLLDSLSDEPVSFLPHKLISLLFHYGLIRDIEKTLAISKSAAEKAEQAVALGENRWGIASGYWTLNAKMQRANNNIELQTKSLMRVAETFVNRSKDVIELRTGWKSSIGANFIKCAIEAYRKIENYKEHPKIQKRIGELHAQMLELQQASIDEITVDELSFVLSAPTKEAIDIVRGKPLLEALFCLASCCPIPEIEQLRAQALKENSGINSIFLTTVHDKHGKTKGVLPNMLGAEDEKEASLRANMYRLAIQFQELIAQAFIKPAVGTMWEEHRLRENDLIPSLELSPFVPDGRERIFARGLVAGFYGDMLLASHILIPQLENSIRHILGIHGHITSGLDKNRIQQEFALNKVLLQTHNRELIEILGEDCVFDLAGLLVVQFGSNLRNEMAHGLLDGNELVSNRFLYLWWQTLRLCLLLERVEK